jgi:hypothetical protein
VSPNLTRTKTNELNQTQPKTLFNSAKPLFVGSIPTAPFNRINNLRAAAGTSEPLNSITLILRTCHGATDSRRGRFHSPSTVQIEQIGVTSCHCMITLSYFQVLYASISTCLVARAGASLCCLFFGLLSFFAAASLFITSALNCQ